MKIEIYLPGVFEPETNDYDKIDLSEIGSLDDAAYEEIYVDSCLDFIPQRKEFAKEIVRKLRYGGKITISGSEIYEIARGSMNRSLTLEETNSMIYNGRYSISSVFDMVASLQQLGLKIIHKRVNDFKYTIVAERPMPNGENTM